MSSLVVKVLTEELKPGQILAEDICDLYGRVLLYGGAILTDFAIQGLRDREYIDAVKVRIPSENIAPGLLRPEESLTRVPASVHQRIGHFFEKARSTAQVSEQAIEHLSEDVQPVIEDIFGTEPAIAHNLRLLSNHDDHTHQHSWMVMLLSLSILREAELKGLLKPDKHDKTDMALGALLHDIGKTQVPLEILNKPGKLSAEEWHQMRLHATFGYRMIRSLASLMPVSKAVVGHHHRYLDGSGYSAEGLPLLENVPDLVRIATVADIYEAIVSDRPYHIAALPYHALKILDQGSGRLYDPRYVSLIREIVAAFPVGSLLLFSGGLVAQVEDVNLKQKDNPLLSVIGSFNGNLLSRIGQSYSLESPPPGLPGEDGLALGAYSLSDMASKIRATFLLQKTPRDLFGPDASIGLHCLPKWESGFSETFGFLLEIP
ncbi:MAG: HD-GYP domain-containing protein [Synergistales bacterium]